jgi:aspartate aminotransferase
MSFIAKRLAVIKPSPTLAVSAKAAKLKAEGKDVIAMGAGDPISTRRSSSRTRPSRP